MGDRDRVRRLAALAAITAAGAAVRFATLGARSFWVDEGPTVRLMERSFSGMLRGIPASEGSPPLYYVLAWAWTQLFGTGEVGLRSLSALLGTLLIPVAYAAASRAVSPRAGLVAAALAAFSPPLVWFSQDGRTYALAVLLAGLSFWTFLRARDRGRPPDLAWWALASTAAICAHYFAAFGVAAEAIWLLWPRSSRPRVAVAVALPAAASVALAVLAWSQRDHGGAFITDSAGLPSRIAQVAPQYVVGFQPPLQVALSVVGVLLLGVVGWLLWRRTDADERAGARTGAIVGGVALLVPVVMAFLPRLDYLIARNTMTAWVPLAIVVAAGLGARRAGRTGLVTLVLLCGLGLTIDVVTAGHSKFDHEDWRGAARAAGSCDGLRAVVVSPSAGRLVLPVYFAGLRRVGPAERLQADEVDVIGLPPPFRRIGRASRPPRPPTRRAPQGFMATQRRDAPGYTFVRYRTTGGVVRTLTPDRLARLALGPGAVVLAQPCPSGAR